MIDPETLDPVPPGTPGELVLSNFGRWGIDGGVRFLQQYGVPQQLGFGAVTIQPSYFQYRLGVSVPIRH